MKFAEEKVSSALQEIQSGHTGFFATLSLSTYGYQALGCTLPTDLAFCEGMKKRGIILKDLPSDKWDEGFRKGNIDAFIILACDDPVLLAHETVLIRESIAEAGGIVLIQETGNKIIRNGSEIEHFGFVDGISQPIDRSIKADCFSETITDPEVVLANDPFTNKRTGSYIVFRKLEQNVLVWDKKVYELAEITKTDVFFASALAVGRFKDGTSLTEFQTMQSSTPTNDFTFDSDKEGNKCPFQAHIRKMNNRETGKDFVRIARRGMTYGLRPDLHPQGKMFQPPDKGVGLLFICYQNSIEKGFELLQKRANDPSFPYPGTGQDPIISQGDNPSTTNLWPLGYKSDQRVEFSFERTVTLKGGEYFFAPGISFLKTGISRITK